MFYDVLQFFIEKGTFHEQICRLQIGTYLLHAIPMASAALLT
jgi:hypothetical protein